jgi:hypothetical protein
VRKQPRITGPIRPTSDEESAAIAGAGVAIDATDDPNRRDRDRRGRFMPGNGAAVRTALTIGRARLPEVFAALDAKAGAFLAQSLADDGGEDLPVRRRSQHEYRAALHLQILRMSAAIETFGLFDRRGRLRDKWLHRLESLIRTATAIDGTLGLARREKRAESLEDWLEAHAESPTRAQEPAAGAAKAQTAPDPDHGTGSRAVRATPADEGTR